MRKLQIKTMPLGSYQTNCYLVSLPEQKKCILIDPGYEPEYVLEQVRRAGKTVEAILLTHGHFDHVGGVKKIAVEENCRVFICKEDLALNPSITDGAIFYTDLYAEGDSLLLAGMELQVLQTPGHTPGSVCLVCEDVIFTGDTLFAGTCGRTDFPGGDYGQMMQSLKRLANLPGDYRVLPGHAEESTMDRERRSNPFMQSL